MPEEFNKGTKPAAAQIQDEFEEMLSKFTHNGDRESSDGRVSTAKAHLQDRARNLFANLHSSWHDEPDIVMVEDDYELEEEDINIAELYKDEDPKDGDSDYSEDSTAEEELVDQH